MGAEGQIVRCFTRLQPHQGKKPLPLAIRQGDQGGGNTQHLAGQAGAAVEIPIGRYSENVLLVQGRLPLSVVVRDRIGGLRLLLPGTELRPGADQGSQGASEKYGSRFSRKALRPSLPSLVR